VRRPPLLLVFVGLLVIALGETAGAALSQLRPAFTRFAEARVRANATAHGLASSAEYDAEIKGRAVYAAEAGLSFFHTHAQGIGPLAILVGTVAANVVPWRRPRAVVHGLLTIGALFPLGYLVYSLAALETGRETGIALAERYVLTPLGAAVVLGLLTLAALTRRVRTPLPSGEREG
jgi:hypothetical protein